MGQNKEQLNKLLDFINELAKDKENAWFVAELGRKYGICHFSDIQNFDAFVRLQHQKCKNKARRYYSQIANDTLRNQLIDDHAMMLWYKSIGELELFFVYVNYQIENMLNFYLDNSNCHDLIKANPSAYCQTLNNPNNKYSITIDCQSCFFTKKDQSIIPLKVNKIKSLWAKILFWAIDSNNLSFVREQFNNFSSIINIRNDTNHAYYGEVSNSSKYWYDQEDDISFSFIYGILRFVRLSVINKQ